MFKKIQSVYFSICLAVFGAVASLLPSQVLADPTPTEVLEDALDDIIAAVAPAVPIMIAFMAGMVAATIGLKIAKAGISFGINWFSRMLSGR